MITNDNKDTYLVKNGQKHDNVIYEWPLIITHPLINEKAKYGLIQNQQDSLYEKQSNVTYKKFSFISWHKEISFLKILIKGEFKTLSYFTQNGKLKLYIESVHGGKTLKVETCLSNFTKN